MQLICVSMDYHAIFDEQMPRINQKIKNVVFNTETSDHLVTLWKNPQCFKTLKYNHYELPIWKKNIFIKTGNVNNALVMWDDLMQTILKNHQRTLLQKNTQFKNNGANPVEFIAKIEPIIHQIKANEESKIQNLTSGFQFGI